MESLLGVFQVKVRSRNLGRAHLGIAKELARYYHTLPKSLNKNSVYLKCIYNRTTVNKKGIITCYAFYEVGITDNKERYHGLHHKGKVKT